MVRVEWGQWANEQAVWATAFMAVTGVPATEYDIPTLGYYGIAMGVILYLFNYPRPERLNGKAVPRMFEKHLSTAVGLTGPIGRSYWVRGGAIFVFGAPCFGSAALYTAGLMMMACAMTHFKAAYDGETWCPIGQKRPEKAAPKAADAGANAGSAGTGTKPPPARTTMKQPSSAPPRGPPVSSAPSKAPPRPVAQKSNYGPPPPMQPAEPAGRPARPPIKPNRPGMSRPGLSKPGAGR